MNGLRIRRLIDVYHQIEAALDFRSPDDHGASFSGDGFYTVFRDDGDDLPRQGHRGAFLIWAFSLIEHELLLLARQLPGVGPRENPFRSKKELKEAGVAKDDLRKELNILEKIRLAFAVRGVDLSTPADDWQFMKDLYELRNLLTHQHGWVDEEDHAETRALFYRLAGPPTLRHPNGEYVSSACDLVIGEDNEIWLASKFLEDALNRVERFLAGTANKLVGANTAAGRSG